MIFACRNMLVSNVHNLSPPSIRDGITPKSLMPAFITQSKRKKKKSATFMIINA